MPKWKHFIVCIRAGGEALPEYDEISSVDAKGIPCVTLWIPSASGQGFEIRCADDRMPRPATRYDIEFDGVAVAEPLLLQPSHGPFAGEFSDVFATDVATRDGRRALVFSDVQVSDSDDDSLAGVSGGSILGDIVVYVFPEEIMGKYTPRSNSPPRYQESVKSCYHEQLKVAGLHYIQYGDASNLSEPEQYYSSQTEPAILKVVFKYRPLRILQARGIAPPSTPSPRESRVPSPGPQVKEEVIEDSQPSLEWPAAEVLQEPTRNEANPESDIDDGDWDKLAELQEEYDCLEKLVCAQEEMERLERQDGLRQVSGDVARRQQQEKLENLREMKQLLNDMKPLKKRKRPANAGVKSEPAAQRARLSKGKREASPVIDLVSD